MIIIIEYDVVYLILRRSGPGHFLISQYLLQNIDISFYHPISLLKRILLFREWNRIVPKRLLWPSRTHKLFSILFHCIYSMDLHKLINVRYKFWKSFLHTFQKFFTPLPHIPYWTFKHINIICGLKFHISILGDVINCLRQHHTKVEEGGKKLLMWGKNLFKNNFKTSKFERIICKQPRNDEKNKQITTFSLVIILST